MAGALRFILNDEDVALTELAPTATLLDFLRLEKKLTGSKEGCAEGDCGACTVLVGRMSGDELVYETVNSCISFVSMMHGTHVVTVENLAGDGLLHPVQQAMVDNHASQCGFCTPGFVMSLYGLYLQEPQPSVPQIETALQGNLCRCTGYAPIVKAGLAMHEYADPEGDPLVAGRYAMKARVKAMNDGESVEIGQGRARLIVPGSVDELARIYAANPDATIVNGATDVGLWVTKFMRDIGPVISIGHLQELHTIRDADGVLTLGAATTYTEAHGAIVRRFPELSELWHRIAGEQIRNAGTVGGNVANGSPIGDTPPPLIVLGATVNLRHGDKHRSVPLEDFFIAYGKQDRAKGEFVESVTIPHLPAGETLACYKVSKRREEDISSVCGAFRVKLNRNTVESVRIAFGGMAATPKRAAAVEAALTGKPWTEATIDAAIPVFETDYQPISDMRASAEYRMLVAKNLLRRFFLETTGAEAPVRRRELA
jgi:xanthine dehydrogenase small subunit